MLKYILVTISIFTVSFLNAQNVEKPKKKKGRKSNTEQKEKLEKSQESTITKKDTSFLNDYESFKPININIPTTRDSVLYLKMVHLQKDIVRTERILLTQEKELKARDGNINDSVEALKALETSLTPSELNAKKDALSHASETLKKDILLLNAKAKELTLYKENFRRKIESLK